MLAMMFFAPISILLRAFKAPKHYALTIVIDIQIHQEIRIVFFQLTAQIFHNHPFAAKIKEH
ncbi:hypothetical protein A2Z53_02935 [Candidatus Giovannonibacteria bacterium RIFCSPHIGHO2_02_42_15]|uniref:Uncharacterized protein n=1 Tax=Candidatus Giovannonibacteria bacterium RIFCSPHIGHO2_02_42_15 TaxID=1798329 RepID=A0A1F5VNB5_9BACT|nr:MAG: hypothetical protein A2Z53_02935 [Candidatus Giovannonibacteria bacterium RIFCSPHIGHO2_02_42_15]